jgi:CubicO group peptidase (beta-lactamase class C family)
MFVTLTLFFCANVMAATSAYYNKLATEFISALNSKNLATIDHFVGNHFATSSLERWNGAGRARYTGYSINQAIFHGELDIIASQVEESVNRTQYILQVISKNTDMRHELVINFNKQAERPITGWYMNEAPIEPDVPAKISEAYLVNEIKNYADKLATNGVFSGTVLLAKGNQVLFSAAHGLASRRYDVKNNLETKFQIGSMNKMFTSVAILQLVESGKLNLNDPITKHVDRSLLGKGEFEKIEIRHLLTHTSGISGVIGFDEIQSKIRSLKDIIPLFKTTETTFTPGTQWQYSGTGMTLLGLVIEQISGMSYYQYIDKHIYQKAGMQNSGSFDLDVPVKNTARNYWFSVETGQLTENLMFQSVKGDPSGGGYSTVADLHKFALALQSEKFISKTLSNEALSGKPELNSPNYGYGFSVRGTLDNPIVGHNGAHLGMSARLNMYKNKGYILAVMGNYMSSTRPIVAKVNQLIEML